MARYHYFFHVMPTGILFSVALFDNSYLFLVPVMPAAISIRTTVTSVIVVVMFKPTVISYLPFLLISNLIYVCMSMPHSNNMARNKHNDGIQLIANYK